MDIRFEKGISKNNSLVICKWSNEKGEEFQKQWMGLKVSYPLNLNKIQKLENIFSIFHEEEFLGIIQIIKIEGDNVHLGRFILNPQKIGQGLGKNALGSFVQYIFKDENSSKAEIECETCHKTVEIQEDTLKEAEKTLEKLGFSLSENIHLTGECDNCKKTHLAE